MRGKSLNLNGDFCLSVVVDCLKTLQCVIRSLVAHHIAYMNPSFFLCRLVLAEKVACGNHAQRE